MFSLFLLQASDSKPVKMLRKLSNRVAQNEGLHGLGCRFVHLDETRRRVHVALVNVRRSLVMQSLTITDQVQLKRHEGINRCFFFNIGTVFFKYWNCWNINL